MIFRATVAPVARFEALLISKNHSKDWGKEVQLPTYLNTRPNEPSPMSFRSLKLSILGSTQGSTSWGFNFTDSEDQDIQGNSNRGRGFLLQHLPGRGRVHLLEEVDGRRQFVNKGWPENETRMGLGSIQFSQKSLLGYMKLYII